MIRVRSSPGYHPLKLKLRPAPVLGSTVGFWRRRRSCSEALRTKTAYRLDHLGLPARSSSRSLLKNAPAGGLVGIVFARRDRDALTSRPTMRAPRHHRFILAI
jgi:hypothetical protein